MKEKFQEKLRYFVDYLVINVSFNSTRGLLTPQLALHFLTSTLNLLDGFYLLLYTTGFNKASEELINREKQSLVYGTSGYSATKCPPCKGNKNISRSKAAGWRDWLVTGPLHLRFLVRPRPKPGGNFQKNPACVIQREISGFLHKPLEESRGSRTRQHGRQNGLQSRQIGYQK
ncbi:hypothetical protein TNCV_4431981 [Trichonephila clavipes]|nr:hypothetical protein TNCV_4431981 [Trichonephila clavipes]